MCDQLSNMSHFCVKLQIHMLHGCHVCQKASDIFSDEKFGLPELYSLTRKSLCSEFWSGLIFMESVGHQKIMVFVI